MKEYIEMNTRLRTASKNDFEKDLYKLLNNSVFGKTMENIRHRVNVEILCDDSTIQKRINSPKFKGYKVLSKENNLVLFQSEKKQILFNKPIFVGFSILDLSKLHMYKFHYDYIKATYGNKAKLLFTDTDSLTYEIQTEDIFKDMKRNDAYLKYFDTSDFNKDYNGGYLQSDNNKKQIGFFKPENKNYNIDVFYGIRSKQYSMEIDNEKDKVKATCKGVQNNYFKRNIKIDDFKKCILNDTE
jgi:hypothetical protein